MDSGKQIFIGVIIVTLIVIIVIIRLSHACNIEYTVVQTIDGQQHMILVKPSLNKPQLVDAGQFPIDGMKFVVASEHTGLFLADSAVMTNDIKSAKIFTYNSKTRRTVELINTLSENTTLVIGITGDHALIGAYMCSNGTPGTAIILDGDDRWSLGYVGCDGTDNPIVTALSPQYVASYSALFYYV